MGNKKATTSKKSNKKSTNKKSSNGKKIAILLSIIAIAVVAVVVSVILFGNNGYDITSKTWYSQRATTASADEVDLQEIYNNNYSTYQGSLTFRNDNTFELWLTAGNPDDGTHKGKYSIKENKINVTFDNGEERVYTIHTDNKGNITEIEVPYFNSYGDEYVVYFQ